LFEGLIEDLGKTNEMDELCIRYRGEGDEGYFCLCTF